MGWGTKEKRKWQVGNAMMQEAAKKTCKRKGYEEEKMNRRKRHKGKIEKRKKSKQEDEV